MVRFVTDRKFILDVFSSLVRKIQKAAVEIVGFENICFSRILQITCRFQLHPAQRSDNIRQNKIKYTVDSEVEKLPSQEA